MIPCCGKSLRRLLNGALLLWGSGGAKHIPPVRGAAAVWQADTVRVFSCKCVV